LYQTFLCFFSSFSLLSTFFIFYNCTKPFFVFSSFSLFSTIFSKVISQKFSWNFIGNVSMYENVLFLLIFLIKNKNSKSINCCLFCRFRKWHVCGFFSLYLLREESNKTGFLPLVHHLYIINTCTQGICIQPTNICREGSCQRSLSIRQIARI
jgi:hypothetical protein